MTYSPIHFLFNYGLLLGLLVLLWNKFAVDVSLLRIRSVCTTVLSVFPPTVYFCTLLDWFIPPFIVDAVSLHSS